MAVAVAVASGCMRTHLERDGRGKARAQPRVRRKETAHLAVVPGEDDNEVIAMVLGQLDQRVERLLTKLVALVGHDRVRLVDDEHAAECRLDHLRDVQCNLGGGSL